MVNYQSAVQNVNTIRFGSAKLELGNTVGTLVNLGVATGIEFEETFTPIIIKPDNAPEMQIGVKDHYANIKFELWELNLSNLNLIRGGIDTYGTTAASPVTVTDELITLTGTSFKRFAFKNGAGTEPSTISVKDSANAATARNTDYVIGLDSAGWPIIARVAGSSLISDGEQVKVTYTYTPNASEKLTSGGKNTITAKVVRLTNTNASGKVFRVTIYAAKNQKGITLKLPGDDSEDVVKPEIELKGIVDTTRTAGDQLFEIYDEQNS